MLSPNLDLWIRQNGRIKEALTVKSGKFGHQVNSNKHLLSGNFGHQVNSDIHFQTAEIQMRRHLSIR